MTDREKVIKGLECCREMDNPAGWRVGGCWDCPYEQLKGKEGCAKTLKEDALVLLKAQEPVIAVKLQSKKYIGRTGIAYDGSCGNCNAYLMRAWRACHLCGKALKWE